MTKYRDIKDRPAIPKMEAVRLLCKDPKDQGEISSLRKAVERAAAKGDLEIDRGETIGKGRNQKCQDTVRPGPFFLWAAAKCPEIESEDRLGPIPRPRTLGATLDVLLDPPLELPSDPEQAVAKLLAERELLLKRRHQYRRIARALKNEVDELRPYKAKALESSRKRSESLRGKSR